jgi:hypothetical protein
VRPHFRTLVAQRDDRWSRSSREIRRYLRSHESLGRHRPAVQNEQIWHFASFAGAARRLLLLNSDVQGHELPWRRLQECLEFR